MMNYSSYAYRSARKGTDIGYHEPLIVKIVLQTLFQSANVISGSDEVASKYVRSMPENHFYHLWPPTKCRRPTFK